MPNDYVWPVTPKIRIWLHLVAMAAMIAFGCIVVAKADNPESGLVCDPPGGDPWDAGTDCVYSSELSWNDRPFHLAALFLLAIR